MVAYVLLTSGLFALVYGLWRGYVCARDAVAPFLRQGEPTRAAIEAARPVHERLTVRASVRSAAHAMLWIAISLYGLYLATVGLAVPA